MDTGLSPNVANSSQESKGFSCWPRKKIWSPWQINIAGQLRTNSWQLSAFPDWPWCRSADAGVPMPECRCRTGAFDLRKKYRCRTIIFRHSDIPTFRHLLISYSGTGMLRYRAEMPECRWPCPALRIKFFCLIRCYHDTTPFCYAWF
jgi:hypothetical protein